jgi:hypothetical protein
MATATEIKAAKMYPKPAAGAAAKPAQGGSAPTTPRQAAAKTLYGGGNRAQNGSGSYGQALSSYYDRWSARHSNDRAAQELARVERRQLADWAQKHGISGEHLGEALSVLLEREEYPAKAEAIAQRQKSTLERIRVEKCGGDAIATHAYLQRFVNLTTDLAQSVPSLAERANQVGAGVDVRLVSALAEYGKPST